MPTDRLPSTIDFFATLRRQETPAAVASLFVAASWQVKPLGAFEARLSCDWAELTLSHGETLSLYGMIEDPRSRIHELLTFLTGHSLLCSCEWYDLNGCLLGCLEAAAHPGGE
jgi:hypothetical protein